MAQTDGAPFFTVDGEVLKPLQLTVEDLYELAQQEVRAKTMAGDEHIYKGVLLADVLGLAGVTLGTALRGENLAKYILIHAVDGYEVIFSLPEIDPEFTDQITVLAYEMDGKPLPEGVGPFRLVIPHEKRHARWIREIKSIKVIYSTE